MFSNSKLTQGQKSGLQALARSLPHVTIEHFPASRMTIAYENSNIGNCVEFAVAVCSPSELKYRKKVGAWHALNRFDFGETSKLPKEVFSDFCTMLDSKESCENSNDWDYAE
jgi:hypothetical protein